MNIALVIIYLKRIKSKFKFEPQKRIFNMRICYWTFI